MAREILYQSVGNPLQSDRLPNRRPELQLPFHPQKQREECWLAIQLLGAFFLLSTVSMFAESMHINRSNGQSFLWTNIIPVTLGVAAAAKSLSDFRWVQIPLACIVGAALFLNLRLPPAHTPSSRLPLSGH